MSGVDPVVIVGGARTPIGSFQGALSGFTAAELGGAAIGAALDRAGVEASAVDEVIMGCVLPAGQGQAPARQAGFHAGLSDAVPATTVNKMCGSGMKAVMLAMDQLLAGNAEVIVAGGMESMSNAPYLLPKMRGGARMGETTAQDHMFLDGLQDAYEEGRLMGSFAEDCAEKYQLTRQAQDDYALQSLSRAQKAQAEGLFVEEMVTMTVSTRKGDIQVSADEQPERAMPDKIPHLKPAFKPDGTVTAANASSISDGAAALVLMRESTARARGLAIRARLGSYGTHAQAPGWFTTAPIGAIKQALKRSDLTVEDVDLWEINEAFAVVPMAAAHELGLDAERLNVRGGACAVGHPIGASGARIIVTLLHAMEASKAQTGVAALCIGGGEGTALTLHRSG
ncbi:MAG: thiolase family protein [Alphaproteobacteria bacterium]